MAARQQKTGCAVVKLCIKPRVHSVARLAGRRESRRHVVWIGSLLKISRVA